MKQGLESGTKNHPHGAVHPVHGAAPDNLTAGLIAGEISGESLAEMPWNFMRTGIMGVGTGLPMIVLIKPLKKLMGKVA